MSTHLILHPEHQPHCTLTWQWSSMVRGEEAEVASSAETEPGRAPSDHGEHDLWLLDTDEFL